MVPEVQDPKRERERERGCAHGRQGIRIEPVREGKISGWHTSSGAVYGRGGGEIGWFWVRC
jgi:hypothetical protein